MQKIAVVGAVHAHKRAVWRHALVAVYVQQPMTGLVGACPAPTLAHEARATADAIVRGETGDSNPSGIEKPGLPSRN
jgi:hypothetical protein